MENNDWKKFRTDAISRMFDSVDENGIYPTTTFFNEIDAEVNRMTLSAFQEGLEEALKIIKIDRWVSHDMGEDAKNEYSLAELNEFCLKSNNNSIDGIVEAITSRIEESKKGKV